jgi:integrase/recombinase XerD
MPKHNAAPAQKLPAVSTSSARFLTRPEFQRLAEVPAEAEWFANIDNPRTRRAYQADLQEFMDFAGIRSPEEMRSVRRSHVIAWRKDLELRALTSTTIRRKLAALSSLFEYLCARNAVETNPVKGVKRPKVESYESKTPALGDHQARKLLEAPDASTIKGKRDQAILSTLLYHALRREELVTLKVKDIQERRGVKHFRVHGKGNKVRYLPAHPSTLELLSDYLEAAGHARDTNGALFRPIRNNVTGKLNVAMTADAVYAHVVRKYAAKIGLEGVRVGPHALRATAATNALDHAADIARVQEWLGHANIATTRIYDRRKARPEDSPTFRVRY